MPPRIPSVSYQYVSPRLCDGIPLNDLPQFVAILLAQHLLFTVTDSFPTVPMASVYTTKLAHA
jgi:hypothetical protein